MSETSSAGKMSVKYMVSRFCIMLAAAGLIGFGGVASGAMTSAQSTACAVFISIIFGTLFFWGFRLAVAFLGMPVYSNGIQERITAYTSHITYVIK